MRMLKIWYCFKELEKTQWISSADLKTLQMKKLKTLITHAYENVPFYHKRMRLLKIKPSSIKNVEDLKKLPILTKKDIRREKNHLIARNVSRRGIIPYSSSGSTGEPLEFFTSTNSRNWGMGAQFRAYRWCNVNPWDKVAQILLGAPPFQEHKLDLVRDMFNTRRLLLNSYYLTFDSMRKFANKIQKFNPKAIIAFPSSAYLFAKYLTKNNPQKIGVEVVITSGEKLHDFQKQFIESTFGCDVFDFYGSREILSLASECPEHVGYHVSIENVFLEIVRQSDHVSAGEIGEVLLTDLHNYVMPFIRYKNEDVARYSNEKCPCGRSLPLLESIDGRTTDIITLRGGGFMVSPAFTPIFQHVPVEWYQIIQEDINAISVKIVKEKEFVAKDADFIIQRLHEFFGNFEINLEFLDNRPTSRSEKWRVVKSKVSPPI